MTLCPLPVLGLQIVTHSRKRSRQHEHTHGRRNAPTSAAGACRLNETLLQPPLSAVPLQWDRWGPPVRLSQADRLVSALPRQTEASEQAPSNAVHAAVACFAVHAPRIARSDRHLGRREPRRDCGRMALGAGRPRGNHESALVKRWAATLLAH